MTATGVRTTTHQVTEDDLASVIYPHLGKPPVLATARLVRWCELAAMDAMPLALGTNVIVHHRAPAVLDAVVTLAAVPTETVGRRWEWCVTARDEIEVIAFVVLEFMEIDFDDYYRRRVAPKLATAGAFMSTDERTGAAR